MGLARVAGALGMVVAMPLAARAQPAPPATPPAAAAAPALPPLEPVWAEHLPKERFEALWPAAAAAAGTPGWAALQCAVDADGRLRGCAVLRETPPGQGFGAAALAATAGYRVDLAKTGPLTSTAFILNWPSATLAWARRPTAQDAHDLLPAGVYGAALLGCGVSETGALEDCFTLRETAPGAGAAALKLAPVMAMTPVTYRGRAIRSAVQIPIHIARPPVRHVRYRCAVDEGPKYAGCRITDGGGLKPEAWPWALTLFQAFPVCPAPDVAVGREVDRDFFLYDPDISKPPPAGAHLVTQPDWAEKPTAEMLEAYYPDSDAARASGGRVVLACQLTAEGRTSNCTVASETPPSLGFGDAAIRISAQLKFRPLTVDCQPKEGGKINLPFTFPPESG